MMGGLFSTYITKQSFEPSIIVQGGPWRFDQCEIRSSSEIQSIALFVCMRGDVTVKTSSIIKSN